MKISWSTDTETTFIVEALRIQRQRRGLTEAYKRLRLLSAFSLRPLRLCGEPNFLKEFIEANSQFLVAALVIPLAMPYPILLLSHLSNRVR
jgi:hypothetical protein